MNQPDPATSLSLLADFMAPLGRIPVTLVAREVESGRELAQATTDAVVVPNRPAICAASQIAFYQPVPLEELANGINSEIAAIFAERENAEPINAMTVEYRSGSMRVAQRYRFEEEVYGTTVTGRINFVANMRPEVLLDANPRTIEFSDSFYSLAVSPDITVVDPVVTPIIWTIAEGRMRNEFESAFRERFRIQLGVGLTTRLDNRINEIADDESAAALMRLFLTDVYINQTEFGIGWCLPRDVYDRIC